MQVNNPSLSKNACQVRTDTAAWEPGYKVRWRCATHEFALADWACDGHSQSGACEELPQHFELYVQRCGWHRRFADDKRYVVDVLHQGAWPGGRPFTLSDNSGRPQAATLLFLEHAALETLLADVAGAQPRHWQRLLNGPVIAGNAASTLQHAQLLETQCEDGLHMQEAALRFVRTFLQSAVRSSIEPANPTMAEQRATERTRAFVGAHYLDPVSLHDVARAAGISSSRLSIVFARVHGTSVWRHVQDLRLNAALHAMPA